MKAPVLPTCKKIDRAEDAFYALSRKGEKSCTPAVPPPEESGDDAERDDPDLHRRCLSLESRENEAPVACCGNPSHGQRDPKDCHARHSSCTTCVKKRRNKKTGNEREKNLWSGVLKSWSTLQLPSGCGSTPGASGKQTLRRAPQFFWDISTMRRSSARNKGIYC